MSAGWELPHRVVIAGGGVAALETMLALRRLAGDGVEIVLVTPSRELVHRPHAAGEPFGLGRTYRFDLQTLTASAGAQLVSSKLVGVEPDDHRALVEGGGVIAYDRLVIASGARLRPALPGASTFWGVAGRSESLGLLAKLESRVAFAAHASSGWDVPLYELALLTESHLRHAGAEQRRLLLITHESQPLAMFGRTASARVRSLFEERGIELVTGREPAAVRDGILEARPWGSFEVDSVVALPGIDGPSLPGLPADERGFIPVDSLGRVRATPNVYAAGEATAFPVKQDGIAVEQAYAVATAIAATLGAPVDPQRFRPVLRGLLLAGGDGQLVPGGAGYDGNGERPGASESPGSSESLWWPSGKIAGRFLAPHLAELSGQALEPAAPTQTRRIPVEIELQADAAPA